MTAYLWIKTVHVTCVVLSYALFFTRGVWMMRESALLRRRWVKIVPHVIDTILLLSAIGLALLIRQYPFVNAWLTAKVVGLVFYIGLGMIALKYGETRRARIAAWIAAQAVFFYIIAVALARSPFPS
ncbi:MAG: SirB2 family protein [Burkholderiales bacterium]